MSQPDSHPEGTVEFDDDGFQGRFVDCDCEDCIDCEDGDFAAWTAEIGDA